MLERGSKEGVKVTCALGGWLSVCVRGVVASVVLLAVWAALVLGVVVFSCCCALLLGTVGLGVVPRSVSSFFLKTATTQGSISGRHPWN